MRLTLRKPPVETPKKRVTTGKVVIYDDRGNVIFSYSWSKMLEVGDSIDLTLHLDAHDGD